MASQGDNLNKLLDKFAEEKELCFSSFKRCWKEFKFGRVQFLHKLAKSYTLYHENEKEALTRQRLDVGYRILLSIIILPGSPMRRIGAFYCLFCLYRTQELKSKQPVSISPRTFRLLCILVKYDSATFAPTCDARNVLKVMINESAFKFCQEDGLHAFIVKMTSMKHKLAEAEKSRIIDSETSDDFLLSLGLVEYLKESPPLALAVNKLSQEFRRQTNETQALTTELNRVLNASDEVRAVNSSSATPTKSYAIKPLKAAWGKRIDSRITIPGFLQKQSQQKRTVRKAAVPKGAKSSKMLRVKAPEQMVGTSSKSLSEEEEDSELEMLEQQIFGADGPREMPVKQIHSKRKEGEKELVERSGNVSDSSEERDDDLLKSSVALGKSLERLLNANGQFREVNIHGKRKLSPRRKPKPTQNKARKDQAYSNQDTSKRKKVRNEISEKTGRLEHLPRKEESQVESESDDSSDSLLQKSKERAEELENLLG